MNDLSKLFDNKIACNFKGTILQLTPVLVEDFASIDKYLKDKKMEDAIDLIKIFNSKEEKEKILDNFLNIDIEEERAKFLATLQGIVFIFKIIFKRSYPERSDEEIASLLSIGNINELTSVFSKLSGMGEEKEIENDENPMNVPNKPIGD